MPNKDALLTPREVAEQLRVSERTLWRWIDKKILTSIKLGPNRGGTVRIRQSDLDAYLKTQER